LRRAGRNLASLYRIAEPERPSFQSRYRRDAAGRVSTEG
jgi:hypothetical protein